MLKKFYLKKLMLCGIVIFAILLIYIIPENEEEKLKVTEEIEYVNKDIDTSIIFLSDSNNYLAMTEIVTNSKDIEIKAKELLEALIIDGTKQDSIPNGFKAIIPSNTKIRSLTFNEGVIKVDFTSELMNTNIENEEKIIEAIVYTLTSINDVEFVIIYMDGNILTTLPQSKKTLPSTLDRSFGINKEYNINSTKDINKTTIYYISEFNGNEYYVPVTKVTNDERSKIEIIVDELSSTNVYKTNLMSYLNANANLNNYELVGDNLKLNFNELLLNDLDEKNILEELVYTISLSVNNVYNNLETVSFYVDNNEVYNININEIK